MSHFDSTPADAFSLVAADGYAGMFQDAPPPSADDLRGLHVAEVANEAHLAGQEARMDWPGAWAESCGDFHSAQP